MCSSDLDQKIELCKKEILRTEDLTFYRVDAGDTQIIFQNNKNKEFFSSWFKNILFTNSSYRLYIKENTLDHFHYGMACDSRYKDYISIDDKVDRCDGTYLVQYYVDRSEMISNEKITALLNYAKKNNLNTDNEFYYEIIQSVSGENHLIKYCRLMLKLTC